MADFYHCSGPTTAGGVRRDYKLDGKLNIEQKDVKKDKYISVFHFQSLNKE